MRRRAALADVGAIGKIRRRRLVPVRGRSDSDLTPVGSVTDAARNRTYSTVVVETEIQAFQKHNKFSHTK